MIAHAADALEHAHSLGIVHRDVKPGNLILDNSGHLWVTDFGLARFGSDADLTMTGDLLGTLRYMSPEQALAKHGLVDHRTDVYSLGATLYELLTLRPAMDGADKQEILRKIAFEEPRPPRSLDRTIPAELETIALKALAKEPADRYATAAELASDLRRWLDDLTIKARPPGLQQRVAKWARRHPGVTATAAISGALVLGLATAGLALNNALMKQERMRTRDALDRTQTALDLAFQSANRMLFDISDAVADAPGLEETQRKVVQSAVSIYEGLGDYKGNAPEVERDRGQAQFRLGMIHDRLGDLKKGGDAYTRAAEIYRKLAETDPTNAEYRYWQALSLAEHGDLCDRHGNGEEAETLARKGYKLFQQAAKDFPDDIRIQAGLADCCLVLGSVNYIWGPRLNYEINPDSSPRRWDESVSLLRKALALYPTVIENAPEQIEYRSRFHRAQKVLSQMPTLSFKEAGQLVQDSVAGYEVLANKYPRMHQPRAGLCEALVWRSRLILTGVPRGLAEAERHLRDARRIADNLVEEYPGVPYYRTLQAGTLSALGNLLAADRPDEAKPLLKQAALYVDGTPDGHVPPWQLVGQAARSHESLGYLYDQAGRIDEAEAAFRQALALDTRVAQDYPNSGSCQSVRRKTRLLASVLSRRGSTEDGIEVHRKHIEFWKAQAARHPANPLVLRAHGWALNDLGYFLLTLGRWDQADEAYGEALDAHDKVERSGLLNPGSEKYWSGLDHWRNGWTWSQMKRGWLYAKAGRPADAEKARSEIVERASRRLDATPPGTQAQREQVRNEMQQLGRFLRTIGRRHESIAAYEKAIRQLDLWRVGFPSELHAEHAANCRMELAFVYQIVGKADEANRVADEAITMRRKHAASGQPMPRLRLGWQLGDQALIRWRTGRVEDAASTWGEAVEIMEKLVADRSHTAAHRYLFESTLAKVTSRRADFLEHTGQFKEAEAAYEKAVGLHRRLAEAAVPGEWYGGDDPAVKYDYYVARDDWRGSLMQLTWFHLRRGHAEQAASSCAEARDLHEEFVAEWPMNVSGLNNLARFLVTSPVETLRDPGRAVRLSPIIAGTEHSEFVGTLGAAQYRAGEFRAAVASLDRATRLEDERLGTDLQLFRAMAHWQVGNTDAARRYYDEAVRGEEWPSYGYNAGLHMLREEAAALLGVK
jgi:tetratricopeptide (TPR) repeat protein